MNSPAAERAVVQLGRTLEWGSRGRGFKSRRPDVKKQNRRLSLCSMFIFCEVPRRGGGTSAPAKTSITDCAGIMLVIRKRHGMAFLGLSSTASASRPGPLRWRGNCITKPDGAEMHWMRYLSRTVAAATGRGFKSRRPDVKKNRTDDYRYVPCSYSAKCQDASAICWLMRGSR